VVVMPYINSRLESVASNGEERYIEGLKSRSWPNGQGRVSMLRFVDLAIVVIKRQIVRSCLRSNSTDESLEFEVRRRLQPSRWIQNSVIPPSISCASLVSWKLLKH